MSATFCSTVAKWANGWRLFQWAQYGKSLHTVGYAHYRNIRKAWCKCCQVPVGMMIRIVLPMCLLFETRPKFDACFLLSKRTHHVANLFFNIHKCTAVTQFFFQYKLLLFVQFVLQFKWDSQLQYQSTIISIQRN